MPLAPPRRPAERPGLAVSALAATTIILAIVGPIILFGMTNHVLRTARDQIQAQGGSQAQAAALLQNRLAAIDALRNDVAEIVSLQIAKSRLDTVVRTRALTAEELLRFEEMSRRIDLVVSRISVRNDGSEPFNRMMNALSDFMGSNEEAKVLHAAHVLLDQARATLRSQETYNSQCLRPAGTIKSDGKGGFAISKFDTDGNDVSAE